MTGSWSIGGLGGELTEGSGGEEQGRRWKEEDGGRVTDKKIHSHRGRLRSICFSCDPAYEQAVFVLQDLCVMLCG